MSVYVVMMAGGVGARFWPRSRRSTPKQVLNIVGENSMIQDTYLRLDGLVDDDHIMVVTTAAQKEVIQQQLPQLDESAFILEPFGRNTAPCIGLAALHAMHRDPEAVMVVLPADHLIDDQEEFQQAIRLATAFAIEQGGLLTMGITPTGPATGYGYIQAGDVVREQDAFSIHRVRSFAEKPDISTAYRFLDSGDFYWNSGMFVWRASTILREISDKLPDIYEQLLEIKAVIGKPGYAMVLERMYAAMKSISIDFGVMQEAENVFMIPTEMGWNDVGSWSTVYDITPKDQQGHAAVCQSLIGHEAANSYVYAPEKVVALVGVENLIVVDTGDALLICHRDKAQNVREAVDMLQKRGQKNVL